MPEPAPSFSGPDLLGGPPFDLEDHKGSYVFVAFMGLPWCGPCKLELPHLVALAHEYAVNPSTPAVRFVIVNYRISYQISTVVTFAKEENVTLPLIDDDGNIIDAYAGAKSWPRSYIVKPSGELCEHHLGGAAGTDQLQGLLLQCGAPAPGGITIPFVEWGKQPPPVVVVNPNLGGFFPPDFPVPIPIPTPDPKPLSLLSRQLMRALALHDAAGALAEREGRRQVRGAALKAAAVALRRLESLAALEAEHGHLPLPPIGPPRER